MSAQQEPGTFLYYELNWNHQARTVWVTKEYLTPEQAYIYGAYETRMEVHLEIVKWVARGYLDIGIKEQAE